MPFEEEGIKIVLNVREPNHIGLLEQIKDNTGINYQNTIKFGLLLMFQEEIKKIKQFKSDEESKELKQQETVTLKKKEEEIVKPTSATVDTYSEEMQESMEGGLLKVHITFIGKLKSAIEIWKYRTGKSYQDISREGLRMIYSFFDKNVDDGPFVDMQEDVSIADFLKDDKGSVINFLKTRF